jgi:endonuclease/exonuclease/phosphatase family metal-dependent hydrolase
VSFPSVRVLGWERKRDANGGDSLYDMNAQALDHMMVSPALQRKSAKYEHIHINSWATTSGMISDHDPSVALLNVCGC